MVRPASRGTTTVLAGQTLADITGTVGTTVDGTEATSISRTTNRRGEPLTPPRFWGLVPSPLHPFQRTEKNSVPLTLILALILTLHIFTWIGARSSQLFFNGSGNSYQVVEKVREKSVGSEIFEEFISGC